MILLYLLQMCVVFTVRQVHLKVARAQKIGFKSTYLKI